VVKFRHLQRDQHARRRRPMRLCDYVHSDSAHVIRNGDYFVSCVSRVSHFGDSTRMSEYGSPPICSACGIAFTRLKNLNDHFRSVSSEAKHDEFYSQEGNATRLKELHGIDWAEMSQQDLIVRSRSRRQSTTRGRSVTRRRSPSSEGDDVSPDNRRRKLDTTTDEGKSPPWSCRISPLVVTSASRKR